MGFAPGAKGSPPLRPSGVAVGGALLQLGHEALDDIHRDVIHTGVVIAELGVFALNLKIDGQPVLVADGANLGVFDGGQGIGHH